MKGLFNYDNPVWHFIGKFWDVLVVNVLWFICCIPIFTIGASTTALYYVTLRLVRDEDGYTIRSFFRSFKENFRQATIIWLIFLFAGIILGLDLWFTLTTGMFPAGTPRLLFSALFVGMLLIWLAMITYVFPVLARFYGTIKQTIRNAFLLSIRYILYTIGIIAIDAGILYLTLTMLPFLMMFGMGLIGFVNSFFLNHIFNKFIPADETRDIHEMRPIFADEDDAAAGSEGEPSGVSPWQLSDAVRQETVLAAEPEESEKPDAEAGENQETGTGEQPETEEDEKPDAEGK